VIATKIELPSGIDRLKFSDKELTDVLTVGARGVSQYLRKFYRQKNGREKNKLGGKRTNFWNRVGNTVNNGDPNHSNKAEPIVESPGRVVVTIASPILPHKIKGGTIKPVRSQYLTIPLVAEAYNERARRFPDLFVIKSKKGNLLLVKPDKSSGSVPRQKFNAKKEAKRQQPKTERSRRENKPLGLKVPERETPTMQEESGFTPYYLLKKSVTQKPWPNSIPTEKQVTDVFNDGVDYWVKTLGERKAA
tara:strand:- start:5276 stop:6019 length:744 start_codon:yes stop_codon:yes gene_type:complete